MIKYKSKCKTTPDTYDVFYPDDEWICSSVGDDKLDCNIMIDCDYGVEATLQYLQCSDIIVIKHNSGCKQILK